MKRLATLRLALAAGVFGCALAAGCSGDTGSIDSAAIRGAVTDTVELEVETDTGPTTSRRSTAPDTVIISRKSPLLAKRIDSMTNTEVGNYLRSLAYKTSGYSIQEATVPCVYANSAACTSGDSATVTIQPEAGMNQWNLDSIPPNGLVVARIINDGPAGHYAANFGYPPQRKTWWVVDDSAGTLRSRYFVRTYSNTGPAITFVTSTRSFTRCAHPPAPAGRPARAKFWNCTQSYDDTAHVSFGRPFTPRGTPRLRADPMVRPVSLISAIPLPRAPRPIALASNWVTCDVGCCASQ